MTFTFPNKPTRVVGITVQRNDALVQRVIRLKEQGYFDDVRVAA